jgi:hypothetical protein
MGCPAAPTRAAKASPSATNAPEKSIKKSPMISHGAFFQLVPQEPSHFIKWCGREDSNFHPCYRTATSTLRVYQFRHDRKNVLKFSSRAALIPKAAYSLKGWCQRKHDFFVNQPKSL